MKMSDEKMLPASRDIAWQALNNVELLERCIPGCESITLQDDGDYALLIHASIGPVRARFKGQMRIKDAIAPTSYTLEFKCQGGAVGFGQGEAQVVLADAAADSTVLRYSVSASVGGKLAQLGTRLVDMAAQKMAADFFGTFLTEIHVRYATAALPAAGADQESMAGMPSSATAPDARPSAAARFWSALVVLWRRLLGKRAANTTS